MRKPLYQKMCGAASNRTQEKLLRNIIKNEGWGGGGGSRVTDRQLQEGNDVNIQFCTDDGHKCIFKQRLFLY